MIRSRILLEGYVALMEEMRNSFEVLVGNSEGKRALERSGRRCEVNLKEI
jgi:hypothetical protein